MTDLKLRITQKSLERKRAYPRAFGSKFRNAFAAVALFVTTFFGGCGASTPISHDIHEGRNQYQHCKELLHEDIVHRGEDNSSRANNAIDELPTEISGAERIEILRIKGARHGFVHVRGTHLLDDDYADPDSMRDVLDSQDDVYSIYSSLINKGHLKNVYIEGFFDTVTTSDINYWNHDLDTIEQCDGTSLDTELEECATRFDTKLRSNALLRLNREGRIKLLPAEREDLYNHGEIIVEALLEVKRVIPEIDVEEALREYPAKLYQFIELAKRLQIEFNKTHEPRENALLERMVRDDVVLGFTSFGGLHFWLNNICEWNFQHPENKFSLVEIVPNGYVKHSDDNRSPRIQRFLEDPPSGLQP